MGEQTCYMTWHISLKGIKHFPWKDGPRSLIDGESSARGGDVEDLAAVTRAVPAPMK